MELPALAELSAGAAVDAMVRGEISAERYAAVLLERCAAGRSLNAFITLEPERVLQAARDCDRRRQAGRPLGLLHGLPVPIKDSINTCEYPTSSGTAALRNFQPRENAPIVDALAAAGAIVLGKTNLHELSFGWTSNNRAFGAVRNPYDPRCIAGGSSGGSAAAVAARMAPLAVAEDTEGSIRVPAALSGTVGLRPTTGRYPSSGVMPISALFDQVGPVARTVADLMLFDQVASGEPVAAAAPVALKGLRLAVGREFWFSGLDPEVARVAMLALGRLEQAGVQLVEAEVPELASLLDLTTGPIQSRDFRPSVAEYLQRHGAGLGVEELLAGASADVRRVLAEFASPGGAHYASESEYRAARDVHLPRLRETLRGYFARSGAAAVVFPAVRVPAPLIGEGRSVDIAGEPVPFRSAIARNIGPGSTAGLPGLVLPAGLTGQGLPVALEFDAPAGQDRALLSLGVALESVLGVLAPPPER